MPGLAFYAEEDRSSVHQVPMWASIAADWGYDLYVIDPSEELVVRGYQGAYSTLCALIADKPTTRFVFLFQQSTIPDGWIGKSLPQYKHPTGEVIYVIGPNRMGLKETELCTQNGSEIISIEVGGSDGDKALWSFDCGLVVMYDRFLKASLGI
jgi:hypothetical protein